MDFIKYKFINSGPYCEPKYSKEAFKKSTMITLIVLAAEKYCQHLACSPPSCLLNPSLSPDELASYSTEPIIIMTNSLQE